MHAAPLAFLQRIRNQHPWLFRQARVLECGSYDINGSARVLFSDCDYVGLDWRPGPGVDVVSLVHEYQPEQPFDVIVSTEMLEHDPHWQASLAAMAQMLAPGGALLLTWASPKRKRHEVDCAPADDYYCGLSAADVAAVVQPLAPWHTVEASTVRSGLDCQLLAIKPLLSVVIGAMNQAALTSCCIQEVQRLAAVPLEIVLVDNGSTPAESARLCALGADIVTVSAEPLGFARTYNTGVNVANGKYLLLLNNDAWPTAAGWDKRMIAVLDTVPDAKVVVATCSRVWHPEQRATSAKPEAQIVETLRASFVAAMMKRETWDAIGPLDERFGIGNFEDDDYCMRVHEAGGKIGIDPGTFFFHVGSVTMRTFDYQALIERNKTLFEEKWEHAKKTAS